MDGTYNLRDVGGYRRMRAAAWPGGTLFRSDSLHRLDSHSVARLAGLNLRTIVDLRADVEAEQRPSAVAGLPARIVRAPRPRPRPCCPTRPTWARNTAT